MELINPIIAFNLGLFSTLHCLGMCGGIIGALSLGGGYGTDITYVRKTGFVVAYNIGRITSYSAAGAVCGFVGQEIAGIAIPDYGHRFLQIAAAMVLVLIGLHLAGWLPRLGKIESFGIRIWRLLQPAARFFIPVDNIGRALAIGMVWGWLPCALVYSVLLWTVTSGSAINGAVIMFAFGLGTLPGMVTAGLAGNRLLELTRQGKLRIWAGSIIILFGILSLFMPVPQQHRDHQQVDHMHH